MQAQRNCNGVYTIYSPKVGEALGKLKHTFLSVVGQVALHKTPVPPNCVAHGN